MVWTYSLEKLLSQPSGISYPSSTLCRPYIAYYKPLKPTLYLLVQIDPSPAQDTVFNHEGGIRFSMSDEVIALGIFKVGDYFSLVINLKKIVVKRIALAQAPISFNLLLKMLYSTA